MRVLVIGASGFIGGYLMRRLCANPGFDATGTYRTRPPLPGVGSWIPLELADTRALEDLFHTANPEVVVHLAAIADVGTAEREPDRATAVNATATSAIAALCRRWEARLVFVSTEYVFDGRRGFYSETDTPNPTTHYGSTKWQAELEVSRLVPGSSIVRTSIVYGWRTDGGRNFVPWLLERLRGGHAYYGSAQVMRTPVYVEHLVDGITTLIEGDYPGIHHIAGKDWVGMYDFAHKVAETFGLNPDLVLPADASPANSPVQPRAVDSAVNDMLGLDCAATMRLLQLPHPGLEEGLAAMRAGASQR